MTITNAMVVKSENSSSPNYKVGIAAIIKDNATNKAQCEVTIIPCLQNKALTETRFQHYWNVHISVDGVNVTTKMLLPDDNSAKGVVSAGRLSMTKGQWYQWGAAKTVTFKNDGNTHDIGVYLHCTETMPRYSPALNTHTVWKFTPKICTVTPSTPSGLKATFVEDTRTITYSWDKPTNTAKVFLDRWLYDVEGDVIGEGKTFELSGTAVSYTETLAEGVALAKFRVTYRSTTYAANPSGSEKVSDFVSSPDLPTDCKVWIKLSDGKWVKAVPWVKLPDGTWKKATKTYTKVGDAWKRTIM